MVVVWNSVKAILLAFLLLPLACKESRGNEKLDTAVQLFIDFNNSQNYKGVWSMWSTRLKEGNDFDEARYIREREEAGLHSSAVTVKDVQINERTAKVTVSVEYVYMANRPAGTAIEEWTFVKEYEAWLFDDYRTISAQ
jgi:sarcosine oxidase delta subunit